MKVKVRITPEYCTKNRKQIAFMVLCGKIRISCIPFEYRVCDYSLYKYALRYAREACNEDTYDKVLCLLENDIEMVQDVIHNHNLRRILQDYQERKKHFDFIPLCEEENI